MRLAFKVRGRDEALECPQVAHLSRADRLALALWWLIENVADEFEMPPERVADEVVVLCGLARELGGSGRSPYRRLIRLVQIALHTPASSWTRLTVPAVWIHDALCASSTLLPLLAG
jgi:hypothetical protein